MKFCNIGGAIKSNKTSVMKQLVAIKPLCWILIASWSKILLIQTLSIKHCDFNLWVSCNKI